LPDAQFQLRPTHSPSIVRSVPSTISSSFADAGAAAEVTNGSQPRTAIYPRGMFKFKCHNLY
jgi:hypothetical protein